MKKLFSLLAVVAMAVGLQAQVARTYEMRSISDVSIVADESISGYVLSFSTSGYYSGSSYNYTAELYLTNADDFLGTFTYGGVTDGIGSDSWIDWGGTTRYAVTSPSFPTSFTISKLQDDTYQISGLWYAAKSVSSTTPYLYDFSQKTLTFLYGPYADEPSASTITLTGDYALLSSEKGETPVVMDFYKSRQDFEYIELQFNGMNQLVAGTYAVSSTGADSTIMASVGYDAYAPYPSYYSTTEGWDLLNYYILDGTATVSFSDDNTLIQLVGTFTTAHGSVISATMSGDNPWYVPTSLDETTMQPAAIKLMRNGRMFIQKNNVKYSVLGATVR